VALRPVFRLGRLREFYEGWKNGRGWFDRRKVSPVRILLDERLPRRVKHLLRGHELVLTVADLGLAGLATTELLPQVVGKFDVFVTIDPTIEHRQDLSSFGIGFVLLRSRTSDIAEVEALVARFLSRAEEIVRGELMIVE
jgi:hypothetical protein